MSFTEKQKDNNLSFLFGILNIPREKLPNVVKKEKLQISIDLGEKQSKMLKIADFTDIISKVEETEYSEDSGKSGITF
jgi:hypothetical protein